MLQWDASVPPRHIYIRFMIQSVVQNNLNKEGEENTMCM